MRRVLLFSLLALLLGALLWHALQRDSGYLLIVAGGKTVEMRLLFAVLALVLVAGLLWALWRGLQWLASALGSGWHFRSRRRRVQAERRTQSGLLHYIEGNWSAAQKDLLKAAAHVEQPLVHYLAAARSACELGQQDKARQWLARAEQAAPGNTLAIALGQARLLLADRQYELCLATLHRAKTAAPHHPAVLDLLRETYLNLRDWAALEALLPELEKNRVLPVDRQQALAEQVCLALLDEAARKSGDNPETGVDALTQVWQRLTQAQRQTPVFIAHYAQGLVSAGRQDLAEPLLRQALSVVWSEPLVTLYGLCTPASPALQLQAAQAWQRQHPDDPALSLALGRICLRNELWGQARTHFLRSLQIRPTPVAHAELARLLACLGEHRLSAEHCQKGLSLAAPGLPDLPMPEATGGDRSGVAR